MMDDLEELSWRRRAIDDAKEALESFIAHRWPIGSPITWMRGQHLQYGEVVNLCLGSVRVLNHMTNRTYWIDIYWVEEALKATKAAEVGR